jgi:hypothetical protein
MYKYEVSTDILFYFQAKGDIGIDMPDTIMAGDHSIKLSNTDKVLFPEDGITKGDLIDYHGKSPI